MVNYNNLQHQFLFIFNTCPIVNEILYESRDKKIISRNLEINLEEKKISRCVCLEIHLEICMPRDTSRDLRDLESNISRFKCIEKKKILEITKSRIDKSEKFASRD